jgi:hypothetical protein
MFLVLGPRCCCQLTLGVLLCTSTFINFMTSWKAVTVPVVLLLPRHMCIITILVLVMLGSSLHCDIRFCNAPDQKVVVAL